MQNYVENLTPYEWIIFSFKIDIHRKMSLKKHWKMIQWIPLEKSFAVQRIEAPKVQVYVHMCLWVCGNWEKSNIQRQYTDMARQLTTQINSKEIQNTESRRLIGNLAFKECAKIFLRPLDFCMAVKKWESIWRGFYLCLWRKEKPW